jgi:hypothetical protein
MASMGFLPVLALLLQPRTLQIDPRDPVTESPCREDQLLAGAAVLERPLQGAIGLHIIHKTLQLGPAHRREALCLSPCQCCLICARFCGSQSAKPYVSTEKTGRDTGRREAEPPEVAQITETVVPLRPWK